MDDNMKCNREEEKERDREETEWNDMRRGEIRVREAKLDINEIDR